MPFRYERDDRDRRVVVRFTGVFERGEALAVLARHRSENIGQYGVLYDLRGLEGHPGIEDIRMFISEETSNPVTVDPRGPIAFLTIDPSTYKIACTCAALGRPLLRIEVFRDRSDADAWLTSRAAEA